MDRELPVTALADEAVCDICGAAAWREHRGVLLCGPHWNAALDRGEVNPDEGDR